MYAGVLEFFHIHVHVRMTTSETYLRSVHDPVGIASCFDTYGVVGVTGVLTRAECTETLGDMGMPSSFNIRDPGTYDLKRC